MQKMEGEGLAHFTEKSVLYIAVIMHSIVIHLAVLFFLALFSGSNSKCDKSAVTSYNIVGRSCGRLFLYCSVVM